MRQIFAPKDKSKRARDLSLTPRWALLVWYSFPSWIKAEFSGHIDYSSVTPPAQPLTSLYLHNRREYKPELQQAD